MNKKTNMIIGGLLVVIGIVLGILGTVLSDNIIQNENGLTTDMTTTTENSNTNEEDVIDNLIALIKDTSYYYESDEQLIEGALSGIVNSLNDPYSVYFSEDTYDDFYNRLHSVLYGIGVSVSINGDYPIIYDVTPGSPAKEAGFEKGQTIKTVDGVDIKDKAVDEIAAMIRGPQGTERVIGVYTDNQNVVTEIHVSTNEIKQSPFDYDYGKVNNIGYGYLKIKSFTDKPLEGLEIAMSRLEEQNMDTLLIDVRDNPGGYLSSVQDICDYFLNTEDPFMYSKTIEGKETPYYIHKNRSIIDYNIIVLINENSASAAEIFSAAMHEIGGYPLLGVTTFGKGTMQNTRSFNEDETKYAKLTTEIWLTPDKEWIHHVGVSPTIKVEETNYKDLSYINANEDIVYDHVNQEIKDVQIFLSRKLNHPTRTDGYFDLETKDNVLTYQAMNDLPQTGIVDEETAYIMNLDIMAYLNDKAYDNQFQEALQYIVEHK